MSDPQPTNAMELFARMMANATPPEPNVELSTAVNAQVKAILAANRWRGGTGPAYGKAEEMPIRELTYDEAVEQARKDCPHKAAQRMELAEWYCPQCKRRLDLNDVGLGSI